jgi:4-methyl-5(b-hydroxyethyl)-thiazole monophosphate biosynthesis
MTHHMKTRVLCLLDDGFEEIEMISPVDLLRRAGIGVVTAALRHKTCAGRCGIRVEADALLADLDPAGFDLLFIPGGPGVAQLREDGRPAVLAKQFHDHGKPVAAICAAPLVLMDAGLLEGRRFTAHQSVRATLVKAVDDRVVEDGNLITSRGAGTALDFGLALVARLAGRAAADRVAAEIMA